MIGPAFASTCDSAEAATRVARAAVAPTALDVGPAVSSWRGRGVVASTASTGDRTRTTAYGSGPRAPATASTAAAATRSTPSVASWAPYRPNLPLPESRPRVT